MKASKHAIDLITKFEGFKPCRYYIGDGKTTQGYGETQGTTAKCWTREYALARLNARVNRDYAPAVDRFLSTWHIKVTQNQFDALVSLAYNLGAGMFIVGSGVGSSMRDALKRGKVTRATFELYRMPGSKFEAGLLRRRRAEWALFSKRQPLSRAAKWRSELTHRRSQLKVSTDPSQRHYLIRRINELKRALAREEKK